MDAVFGTHNALVLQWVVDVGDDALDAITEHGENEHRRMQGHAQRAGWSFSVSDGNAEPRKTGAPHRLLPMVKNFAELCAAYDAQRAEAIVKATTFDDDADVIAKISRGLGEVMVGINVDDIPEPHHLAERGW